MLRGEIVRALDGFLRFDREFVPTNCHFFSLVFLLRFRSFGSLRSLRISPAGLALGWPLGLTLRITNAGARAWPIAVAPARAMQLNLGFGPTPRELTVELTTRWRPAAPPGTGTSTPGASDAPSGPDPDDPSSQSIPLRRDVPPGETITQKVLLTTPPRPGLYDLEIGARQVHGARFTAPGNEPLRVRVEVMPRPSDDDS